MRQDVFTGIVEELGEVTAVDRLDGAARIRIAGPRVTADARPGDSIAVNGVCLTVVDLTDGAFTADVMLETLRRSTLADATTGQRVNLERAATLGSRLGGHLVQGHVDGTGRLLDRRPTPHWELVRISLPPDLARYLVPKGSIAVDGVSLTVVDLGDTEFSVGLIPTTLASTTLGLRSPGDRVNLEVDIVAKYVAKYVERLSAPHVNRRRGDNVAVESNGS